MINWTFSIRNKTKAALTIVILCGVVFISNYRLKKLSNKVGASVASLYEDRLLVQDLLFSYNNLLDSFQQYPHKNKYSLTAEKLQEKYLTTQLTREEETLIFAFYTEVKHGVNQKKLFTQYQLSDLKRKLNRLEQIQVEEAKKQMALIKKAKHSQETGYYFETAILIVLLVIVQILITANTIPEQLSITKSNLN